MKHRPVVRPVLAALAALAAGVVATSPALAAVEPDDEPPFSASLAAPVPAIVTKSDAVSLRVALEGGLTSTADVTVVASVTTAPLTSTAQLDAFTAAPLEFERREFEVVAPLSFGPGSTMREGVLDPLASQSVSVPLSGGTLGLPADTWGVYGLTLEARAGDELVWSLGSPLTWIDAETPVLPTTVIATISAPAERADALLQAASDTRVVILADPTVLTAEQRELVAQHEAYALPAGHVDLSAAAHTGSTGLLDFAVDRSLTTQQLPWLGVAAALDDRTVQAATHAGATAVLLDTRFAARPPAAAVATIEPPGDTPLAPVVLPHTRLSAALGTLNPHDPATTATVVAEAALAARAGLASVVISPGDRWVVGDASRSPAIQALLSAPFIEPRGLAVTLSDTERTALDLPNERFASAELDAGSVSQLASLASRLETLGEATTQPSPRLAALRAELLSSMSLVGRVDPERRDEAVASAISSARATLASVAVTSGSQLNLVSSSGNVPVTVSNALDVPLEVTVVMTSPSSRLVIEDQPSTVIEPGTEATVTVPVTAVSSGDLDVSVAVRGPEGQTLAVAETLHMRVRAEWGNAITVTLSVLLALLLLAGIWRTIRRGRRDTRVRPAQGAALAGDDASPR